VRVVLAFKNNEIFGKDIERSVVTDKNNKNAKKRPREALSRTKIIKIRKIVREKGCHGQK